MGKKEINGPLAVVVVVVVIVLAIGAGYFYMNKGQIGADAQPKKLGRPGEIPPGADTKMGPFPSDTRPDGVKVQGGPPGVGAPPSGVVPGGR